MRVSPGGDLRTGAADDDLGIRGRRARSWYERGVAMHETDEDLAFILYWIAFNAAYGKDLSDERRTSKQFGAYFRKLACLDKKRILESALWDELSTSVDRVLKNKYLHAAYWHHLNGESEFADWQRRLQERNTRVESAGKNGDLAALLSELFHGLYTLRNQLLHGGATWNSGWNRDSVALGADIMKLLVPIFVELMLDNPQEDWGLLRYPSGLGGRPRSLSGADSQPTR